MLKRYLYILKYGFQIDKSYLSIRLLLTFISFISSAIILFLPKILLNAIALKNFRAILIILCLSFFISTIEAIISRFVSPRLSLLREKINARIINDFLHKGINLDLEYFDRPGSYDKYTITFGHCCTIVQGSFAILLSFISSLLQVGLVIYVLSWLSPIALLFFLIVCLTQPYINNLT